MMRQGIPSAGNFLHQELAILTGAVEAMVVDVQCIMQALGELSGHFHTELITTSPKVHIPGAVHVQFDEHRAYDIAKEIVKRACDNFPKRGETFIPDIKHDLVPGFSHEYIDYMLGGSYRRSFRPLNDAIMAGRIRGAVAVIGCSNPRVQQDAINDKLVQTFLANDILVVQTGCGAIASAKIGMLRGEGALEFAGPGLREVCEATGMPPVLHMGSCVDNSRILTVLTQVAGEGGLGDDIADIPAVGMAPEWMSEKALSIATYCVASGAYVIMGVNSPVSGMEKVENSQTVSKYISSGWEAKFGGKLEFIVDPDEIIEKTLEHIDKKRAALGLPEYDPSRFGKSGDARMLEFEALPEDQKAQAMYGAPAGD
jgi:carbon-monoxide dehydrogenase catalytic subunit